MYTESMGQSKLLQRYEFSASESKHCFVNLSSVLRTVSGVEGWEGDPISKKEKEFQVVHVLENSVLLC